MNIMRKLWVGGAGGGAGGGGPNFGSAGPNGNQSISLGLMHLRKLFGEYLHAPSDDKIYNMLPLFCKVWKGMLFESFCVVWDVFSLMSFII